MYAYFNMALEYQHPRAGERASAPICRPYTACINHCRKEPPPSENTTGLSPENAIYMIIRIVTVHQNFRAGSPNCCGRRVATASTIAMRVIKGFSRDDLSIRIACRTKSTYRANFHAALIFTLDALAILTHAINSSFIDFRTLRKRENLDPELLS